MSENQLNDEQIVNDSTATETTVTEQPEVSADTTVDTTVSSSTGNDTAAVATNPQKSKFAKKLDDFFGITKAGSTIKLEIIGGLTTFMAMVYILMVNAGMFSDPFDTGLNVLGVSYGAIYIATALSAVVGTLLMAFVARLPMAQASGMGLNAFFVYTICVGQGLSYANALVLILIEGVVFIILTLTGLRKMLFDAIPQTIRVAIPAGIGLFIAFLGLQNAGIVVLDTSTKVNLVSLNVLNLGSAAYSTIMPILVTILAVIAMASLSKRGNKGAILWSILGATVLYYALMGLGCAWNDTACKAVFESISLDSPIAAFKQWGTEAVGQVFANGFDFSGYLNAVNEQGELIHSVADLTLVIITSAFSFCMVDMFDTMGTLFGACKCGNMLTEDGEVPNMNKAMLSDAIATAVGAICGTSTVTTFVESSSGVGAGARTGFASVITAACFFVAMFLSPIAQLIPTYATAAALIYVGVLMMKCVRDIEWNDPAVAVPSFLTIAIMPFTYNISYGIAFGLISYVLIKLCTGKVKDIHPVTAVIAALFFAMFLLTH